MSVPLEHRIASLLHAGRTIFTLLACAGATWFLAAQGGSPYRAQHTADFGEGRGLMQLGILILIVTPVARVAFSICAFAKARDRVYAAISAAVFCILLYSLLGGR
jgi:uncharacterized membrane protein